MRKEIFKLDKALLLAKVMKRAREGQKMLSLMLMEVGAGSANGGWHLPPICVSL